MQNDAVDIEGNIISSGEVKVEVEISDKNKPNEESSSYQPSTSGNTQDQRFNEITKMIKDLSVMSPPN